MFSIDDSGEIRLRDLSLLNSSTAHLVAVATDNGLPPRQVSIRDHKKYTFPKSQMLDESLAMDRTKK